MDTLVIMQIADWQKKLPTRITLLRIVLSFPTALLMLNSSLPWKIAAAALFSLAAFTDYLDGYYARKYNSITNFGKLMDPVADKILVTTVLTFLLFIKAIDPWMVALIVARDNFIGGIRAIAAADKMVIDAKPAGKWKTALQMAAIPVIMISFNTPGLEQVYNVSYGLLWISVLLSITSGIEYSWAYFKTLKVGF